MRGVGNAKRWTGRRVSSMAGLVLALFLALASTTPSSVSAQRNLDLQLFLPPAAAGSTFTVARPEVARHLTFVVGADASWAREPLRAFPPGSDESESVV